MKIQLYLQHYYSAIEKNEQTKSVILKSLYYWSKYYIQFIISFEDIQSYDS